MTDNEIIKALECYKNSKIIQVENGVVSIADVLDLINRQKAEIEELTAFANQLEAQRDMWMEKADEQKIEIEWLRGRESLLKAEKHSLIKAEAIKEFAERLKEDCPANLLVIHFDAIDNLVKEMVGDNNVNTAN